MARLTSYDEFWPYYVAQHLHPVNRVLHVAGTLSALASCLMAAADSALWLAVVPVAGYGPAWIGHFFFEKNRPATFRHPLWSLRGDLSMFALTLAGRMGGHIARAESLYPAGA